MSPPTPWLIAAALTLTAPSGAHAWCEYRGQLDARTTIAREFADSPWVVRARVVSATDNWTDGSLGADEEPWTLYRVRVVERFKGEPPAEVSVLTFRDSGGFYMDRGARAPDIGGEYLLFLQPTRDSPWLPDAARGGTVVNYSCGRSMRWAETSAADRGELARLAGAR
ncbi:MAG: hypothetical protein ACK4VY_02635 [Brevundimonas sp.]